jgi:arylsulfatase A-like enzyme
VLSGNASSWADRPIFLQRRFYQSKAPRGSPYKGFQYGLKQGDWKYLRNYDERTEELYDMAKDPGELKDLAEVNPEKKEELKGRLEAMWDALDKLSKAKEQTLSEEEEERFEAMGYIK